MATTPPHMRGEAGATHLRPGDIIVMLILLGVLLYAAVKQFPVYNAGNAGARTPAPGSHQP